MHSPEVLLENSDAVYDYYQRHQQNRWKALASYAVLARQAHRWVPGRSAPGRGLQRVVGGAFILLGLALLLTL